MRLRGTWAAQALQARASAVQGVYMPRSDRLG